MTHHFLPGDPDIPLVLRHSARARRISLRVSQLDGRVTLTLPKRVALQTALEFAREKEPWIRKHLASRGTDVQIGIGAVVPIEGQMREVSRGTGRKVVITDTQVMVPGPEARVAKRLEGHLKTLARTRLAQASDLYAARLGKPYSAMSLRDTRSRWGSCSAQGRLMYSWRLVLAPPDVLSYVAAHEVAHLAQMNHSPAFWETVTDIFGPYQSQRAWLRRDGNNLHRYRFTATS